MKLTFAELNKINSQRCGIPNMEIAMHNWLRDNPQCANDDEQILYGATVLAAWNFGFRLTQGDLRLLFEIL